MAYLYLTSLAAVSGVGGCSFLLHFGQSEQLDSLQHSTYAAVQVNTGPLVMGAGPSYASRR